MAAAEGRENGLFMGHCCSLCRTEAAEKADMFWVKVPGQARVSSGKSLWWPSSRTTLIAVEVN